MVAVTKINTRILLFSVFVIAICGIFYELLLSTIASYFLGSSILQFSITIGFFLFFMGVGSFLSKFITQNLIGKFVAIEIVLGVIGGFSTFLLNLAYIYSEDNFHIYNVLVIGILGTLVGLEIPIVTRIINQYESVKDAVAKVLSFDYVGALVASLLFPLLFLPFLGVMKTAFLIGIINAIVALFNSVVFRKYLAKAKIYVIASILATVILSTGFVYSLQLDRAFESAIYQDKIIFSQQSAYQKIVITKWRSDYRLFINGSLQFSSTDEYRYHESLVHIPMLLAKNHEKVLILGGGDGMAARELMKYQDVKTIHLVDLDPMMTNLAKENMFFTRMNHNSFKDSRIKIFNEDAFKFVTNTTELYDLIIIDLPDPKDTDLGKLYSREFYEMVKARLSWSGLMVTQATSPYFARSAFWCIHTTCSAAFERVTAYTVNVPSFGQWGFVLAGNGLKQFKDSTMQTGICKKLEANLVENENRLNLKYLNQNIVCNLFNFDKDTEHIDTDTSSIKNQCLIKYYEKSLENWK